MKETAYGYLIFDSEGRAQLQTFRSNRSECWAAFVGIEDERRRSNAIKTWKRLGFRCLPGYFSSL